MEAIIGAIFRFIVDVVFSTVFEMFFKAVFRWIVRCVVGLWRIVTGRGWVINEREVETARRVPVRRLKDGQKQ